MIPRIPITDVEPVVENGRYAAKASVGEAFRVSATVFREGHDALGCGVVLVRPDGSEVPVVALRRDTAVDDPDHWTTWVTADAPGPWGFRVESWADPYATWVHDATVKIEAGVDVELMLLEGSLLLQRAASTVAKRAAGAQVLTDAVRAMRDTDLPVAARLAAGAGPAVATVMAAHPVRDLVESSPTYAVQVDRPLAAAGAWYEFFPRSEGAVVEADGSVTPGTLRTAALRLDAVAAMGFDVIYLPPIHPIGEVNRKGPNNTLTPGPGDPGSPWAIGSADGGHDAVHPDLGTIDDLDAFVARATELGLEVALDLALQCAPDHPWVAAHPEWFTTRADGSIAYAENPPKKYQDIYPLNFDNDPDGLYAEVLRVVRHWMDHGVRVFRVDNPHTKPVAFWERLLGEIRSTDPDVVFLSEAFTKPAMMRGLGTVGFHQSYSYFTWRNAAWEIAAYLTELSAGTSHLLRPNFFVNTPDILPGFLQHGGPPAFRIRAAIAATSGASWGVYAGFELYEHAAVRPGSEEYLDSEKYQVRVRDWDAADREGRTLAPYLTRLNEIRAAHPALRQLPRLTIHPSDNGSVLCWSKAVLAGERLGDGPDDVVVVVVTVDPHSVQESIVHLDLPALGLAWDDELEAHDEITGQTWVWGAHPYVRLDPHHEPAHVVHVRRRPVG